MAIKQLIILKSSDDKEFSIDRDVAMMSKTIADLLADTDDQAIPLPNVTSNILIKVIEYCTHHAQNKNAPEDDLKTWDQEFMKIDQAVLYHLTLAANYLDIRPLLELCCKTVADMIRGKSAEEIRQVLNIQNDLTPEDEEQIRRESAWVSNL
eukprot:TRINITY_DN671_c0_g1::TRINITY_DN671_c0_g1_i1::g.28815::m.28815 TRINITY_DN671_c0_g1::TRINITY_DN671_c0_g1_i1::g.28815  ORF type:complete len:173 (-),score=13.15,sp/P52285/SKP1A_DICDI/51.92/5e-50,Skp1/PF01466.14/2.3e+03,Skp1/PF01466.14/1.5e-34,Skp1_POZ/PF03931.10/1.7e-22,Skp1_POZ/PF03931.10/5.6e+03,Ribosomal_L22/PF00237.14/3.3,Ribosomal_L22/PF00237.14/32,SOCS_box/PF07525.11/1.3e+03,SOCS_box/PF07525.11/0.58,Med15_fungi/PF05397.7/4e+03,Med15_fungi/PF05397.7/15,Med15_fungi/PF05397.7/28 TRINITY_DN671_c0